jgi:enamine deaminase RidA (YjgF/YER057c/UK114 family)
VKRSALTRQAPHVWPFSHGTVVEGPCRLVFLAGQVAYDRQGSGRKLVGQGDPAAQARQAIENVRTLLREAGGDLADVVEMTAYVTDVAHAEAMGRVAQEYFRDPLPAMSLIGVKELARPEFLVELRVIAAIDLRGRSAAGRAQTKPTRAPREPRRPRRRLP